MTLRIQTTLCTNCGKPVARENEICIFCGRVLPNPYFSPTEGSNGTKCNNYTEEYPIQRAA